MADIPTPDQDYCLTRKYEVIPENRQTPTVRKNLPLGGFAQRGELGNTTYRPRSKTKQVTR